MNEEDNFSTEQVKMNDPIIAASFSSYDRLRLGCFVLTISLIVALTVFSTLKPTLHPLTLTGDTFSLHLSISAVENILMDDPIINNITAETETAHRMLVINHVEPLNVAMNEAETKSAAQIDRKWRNYADPEPLCRALKPGADYCDIEGDVRIYPNSSTIFLVKPILETNAASNWIIEPYPRRGTGSVKKWTVKLAAEEDASAAVPKCDQFHSLPALLFSIGGFTGNHFHDFADLLVPLFTTSFQFNRDVQFLATDYKPWWPAKFRPLLHRLSGGEMLDIDREKTTHCFSRLIAGLKFHSELMVDSDSASGATMPQFRRILRQTYSLNREKTIARCRRRPRLMIISRKKTRILTNEEQISRAATKLGFEVVSAEGGGGAAANLTEFAQLVNSCDAMAGVHGAGLTNMVFLPEKAVVVQIVPLGAIDALAKLDFGKPAAGMRLRYLDYKIEVKESSLIQRYPADHVVIRDPMSIHRQGWGKLREVYLDNQNVTIDVRRFRATLAKTLKLLCH